jgi:hypothetical protein
VSLGRRYDPKHRASVEIFQREINLVRFGIHSNGVAVRANALVGQLGQRLTAFENRNYSSLARDIEQIRFFVVSEKVRRFASIKKLMEIIGDKGGGALVTVVAPLMAMMRWQPNFDHERFKEEISSLVEHPQTTEFQKRLWNCLIQLQISNKAIAYSVR